MSVAVGEEAGEDPKEEQKESEEIPAKQIDSPSSTPKIVPVSLHDASLQALLSCAPLISPVLSNSSKTVASSSSSCHSQETSPTTMRHPFCVDRSILVRPPRSFSHKRNKSAPIWLHRSSSVKLLPEGVESMQRRSSFDELYNQEDSPSLPLKLSSAASTDEGVWTSCYESGSASTPSTEDKLDDNTNSISSCVNSSDLDEAYNTESSSLEFTGYPGLVSSRTWIEVQEEQTNSNLVSVKVGSKSSHVVHFSVKAGDVITWEFATLKRDIGFGILFECSVVEEKKCEDGELTDVDSITSGYGVIPILPIFKVKSNISPIFGSHEAVTDGVYVMTWDNSYSRFFAKDLYYRISTQTEICTSEFPHGIISFQHSAAYPALEEVEESNSSHISSGSDANEHTLCESSDERNVVMTTVITQNHVDEANTVYFDVAKHSSTNDIHDI
ncbi:uncharacterized protein LOC134825152 [Bolinopsis microptera]|uniref:uncharacterized protein LOC134825152 n=1 Tax=Bolinopsis microptera TaxID=2820187 RepID=UPI00307ACDD9